MIWGYTVYHMDWKPPLRAVKRFDYDLSFNNQPIGCLEKETIKSEWIVIWLVVEPLLWKIWVRQLGLLFPTEWKIIKFHGSKPPTRYYFAIVRSPEIVRPFWDDSGVGKCPNWTSPKYWGYNFQQIFEGDVQNPQKGTFTNPCDSSY